MPNRPRLRPMGSTRAIKKLQIKKILVPVDFSSFSHGAIKFALPLLKRFGAELHLVHVAAADVPIAGLAAMPIVLTQTESVNRVRQHLKRSTAKYADKLKPTNIHVLRGDPYLQISQLARDLKIDLIVISSRGQTGVKHLLLGSTAERVLRYSPCPVLIFHRSETEQALRRNGKAARPELKFEKILVPTDFSDCSMRGLEFAEKFATEFGSEIMVMHSVHLDYFIANDEYARYDFPQLLRQTEEAAQKQLRDVVAKIRRTGLETESALTIGHAGQHICERASQFDVDLIVTSTHGRTGFKHVLLGSTAEYVARHADCPVLVVPSHDRPIMKPKGGKS